MDAYKWFSIISTIIASVLGIGSFIIVVLNRRSTARKETVDGMLIELKLRDEDSARRDAEIDRLKAEVDSLTKRIVLMESKERMLESTVTRLERERADLLAENRELRKQVNRAHGRDSDGA